MRPPDDSISSLSAEPRSRTPTCTSRATPSSRLIQRAAVRDDAPRDPAGLGVPPHDARIFVEHGDAGLVRMARLAVVQIDLLRRFENRARAARGAAAVRRRGLEGNGNDDDARL